MKTEVIVLDSKAYDQLKIELSEVIKQSVYNAVQKVLEERGLDADWLKKEPAMELLGIRSKSKLQELRDRGEIEFSQRANSKTIMYSRLSILEYLENNRQVKLRKKR